MRASVKISGWFGEAGLAAVGERCGRAGQVAVMVSDHHGFDQQNADAKPAPSGGCYHHPS